jgi:hypothetical protein
MSSSDFRTEDARAEADLSATQDESVKGRDAGPIDEDAMKAADGLTTPPGVKEHYKEMTEIGANVPGEGQVP